MTVLGQFLLYNLLPSVVVGALVWLLIVGAINLLCIRRAELRLSLLAIPLVKSLLILLGVGLILPWPEAFFENWQANAVSWRKVIPFVLLWAGGATLFYQVVVRRTRRRLLGTAKSAPPRLEQALDQVMAAQRRLTAEEACGGGMQCGPGLTTRPQLLVSDSVASPLALTAGGRPTILFPPGLAPLLSDAELRGALGHEVSHFVLRWPRWCALGAVLKLALISPVAGLVSAHISREEERACDDMAVRVAGDRETYADMLLKSYRYALNQDRPWKTRLSFLPRLVDKRPSFSRRVERLLHDPPVQSARPLEWQLTMLIWILAGYLFFSF